MVCLCICTNEAVFSLQLFYGIVEKVNMWKPHVLSTEVTLTLNNYEFMLLKHMVQMTKNEGYPS